MDIDDATPFEGTRVNWIWSGEPGDARFYRAESVFISAGLFDEYEQYAAQFDEESLRIGPEIEGELEERSLPVDPTELQERGAAGLPDEVVEALERNHVPENEWYEKAVPVELRGYISRNALTSVFLFASGGVSNVASLRTHGQAEDTMRQSQPNLGGHTSNQYSGPLFVYALDKNRAGNHKLVEPKAPINVAWENSLGFRPTNRATPVNVSFQMQSNMPTSWNSSYNRIPQLRHVIVDDGRGFRLVGHDDDAAKQIPTPFRQWHCRLFDVPNDMDAKHDVAGQAHRDPVLHGHVRGLSNLLRNVNWRFTDSRDEVGSDWDGWSGHNRNTVAVGNDTHPHTGVTFGSSNGELDRIT